MNLSIDADLQRRVRECGLNASAIAERALAEEVRRLERQEWLRDNQAGLDDYNRLLEDNGLFSDGLRSF
jgi:antitoxin CcdA